MRKVLSILVCLFITISAFATGDVTPTSKGYVDAQMATLQDNLPGAAANTVVTTTATAGETGTKSIYDASGNYAEQMDALVTAADANTAVLNSINGELICTEYGPGGCWVYSVRSAIQSLLPAGYTAIEYIRGTGTQWIDTGIYLSNNHRIQVKAMGIGDFFGVREQKDTGWPSFGITGGPVLDLYAATNEIQSGGRLRFTEANNNTVYIYHIENGLKYALTTDGTTQVSNNYTTGDFTHTTYTAPVFAIAWGAPPMSDRAASRGYLYYLKIWHQDTLVRDMIPVRRDSDDEVGLYDLVSHTFFTNAGTGEFIAGPDLNVYLPNGN